VTVWLNRDPIAERGGMNLYAFVGNDPIDAIDPLGMEKLSSITIKRKHVKWLALLKQALGKDPGPEDIYGHWWIVFDGESYGWWPKDKVGLVGTVTGVPGELNGQTSFGGSPTQDPHHGDSGETEFNPYKQNFGKLKYGSKVKCCAATEAEIKDCAREFAKAYSGNWSYPWGQNCHSFQRGMMNACCMKRFSWSPR
jgi:hypothetical protein